MPADLREPEAARQLFERAEAIVGPLDILINNAAIATTGLIAKTSDEDFDATMMANVRSPFVLIREAARSGDGRCVGQRACRACGQNR